MTKNITKFAIFLSLNLISYISFAEELSGIDQEALKKTQGILTNKAEREKAKQGDEALKGVDRDVESLAGDGANKEAIYKAAAKIMEEMAKEAGGDAIKMQEVISKAQQNPQKFMESLSESNKSAIRGIANDIEKTKVDTKQP